MKLSEQLGIAEKLRLKTNSLQSDGYNRALTYMSYRIQNEQIDLQEEEIKLINLIRIILQGGWIIDSQRL